MASPVQRSGVEGFAWRTLHSVSNVHHRLRSLAASAPSRASLPAPFDDRRALPPRAVEPLVLLYFGSPTCDFCTSVERMLPALLRDGFGDRSNVVLHIAPLDSFQTQAQAAGVALPGSMVAFSHGVELDRTHMRRPGGDSKLYYWNFVADALVEQHNRETAVRKALERRGLLDEYRAKERAEAEAAAEAVQGRGLARASLFRALPSPTGLIPGVSTYYTRGALDEYAIAHDSREPR